jgi:hypothetical protein
MAFVIINTIVLGIIYCRVYKSYWLETYKFQHPHYVLSPPTHTILAPRKEKTHGSLSIEGSLPPPHIT